MANTVTYDLYCRLNLQTEISEGELNSLIVEFSNGERSNFSIINQHFVVDIMKNDSYDVNKFYAQKRFVFSRYIAEVEPLDEDDVDSEAYLDSLCGLISKLRSARVLVSAACEYEDVIAERTGWNWSEATPEHPPVV